MSEQQQHPEASFSGRGVSNYNVDRPSNAFTTSTTQFDDILIEKNIISMEQAMMAKGASYEQAQQLVLSSTNHKHNNHHHFSSSSSPKSFQQSNNDNGSSDNDDDEEEEEEDEWFEQYRAKRLQEFEKKELQTKPKKKIFGDVVWISRPDWNREVNEASMDGTWVLILLTTTQNHNVGGEQEIICRLIQEQLYPKLAILYPTIKFVCIPSHHAISNWPSKNLPTIFCYQNGSLSHQLIGIPQIFSFPKSDNIVISQSSIEQTLFTLGIIDSYSKQSYFNNNTTTTTTTNDDDDDDEEDFHIKTQKLHTAKASSKQYYFYQSTTENNENDSLPSKSIYYSSNYNEK